MKVNAICSQNFRGILTESESIDYKTDASYDGWNDKFEFSSTSTYQRMYYPFIGETKSEIQRAIEPYTLTESNGNDTKYNKVVVKQTLPVTKEKFMKYLNDDLLSDEHYKIRDCFVLNNLKCFIKENFLPQIEKYHII